MNVEEVLVNHVLKTNYRDLPNEVILATKKQIIDFLGIAVAGSAAAGCKNVVDLVSDLRSVPQGTVIVYGIKVSAAHAALSNAMMAHALDFDDTHEKAFLHATAPVIATAFASAELVKGISGKDLITAVAVGTDIGCRLALAVKHSPTITGWHTTATYGVFSAAATAAKILGCNKKELWNAFGIAYSQSAGNVQSVFDGALAKRLQAGIAAKAGVLSVLLAVKGLTGPKNFLKGKYGFYNVYERGDWDPQQLINGIGNRFEGIAVGFKPYPCCRRTHTCVDATLKLIKKYNIIPEQIKLIKVHTTKDTNISLVKKAQRHPRTVVDAQFSIPYIVATAIVKGDVSIENFTEKAIRDSQVLRLTEKVEGEIISVEEEDSRENPAKVEIILNSGQSFCEYRKYPKGHPMNPMNDKEILNKFKKCWNYSVKPLGSEKMEFVINLVKDLESVTDATKIIKSCTQ